MDNFYFCLGLGPLAVYFVALGLVNLSRRPVVVSGGRDAAALALALAGLMIGGPMQLFFPEQAAARFGPLVWALLISFYTMAVTLWALVARPRLVVYNALAAELRPLLAELARELDPDFSFVADTLALPKLSVRLALDEFRAMRNVSLVAVGDEQSPAGWRQLERALAGRLRQVHSGRNPGGFSLICGGLLLLAMLFYKAMENPQAIAQGFREMLRL